MAGIRERFQSDASESAAVDAARHRMSVLVYLRTRGYRHIEPGVTARDVVQLALEAGVTDRDLEDEVMPSTDKAERHLTSGVADAELEWLPEGTSPPPTRNGDPGKYARIAEQLKKRPGRWALIAVPRGSIQALRRRGIQTVQRNGNGKEPTVYARWSGS